MDVLDVVVFALRGSVEGGDGFPGFAGIVDFNAFGKVAPASFERCEDGVGKVQVEWCQPPAAMVMISSESLSCSTVES